jgi:predicted NUDIX family phosphoesterase
MKHPQYIVAILKSAFGPLGPGLNEMTFGRYLTLANQSFFIGRRHELETNEDFGQLLPYVVLRQGQKVFVYERTKMVGEQRLAGKSSVGIGGHVDLSDIMETNGVIDVMATLAFAVARELNEEIVFVAADGSRATTKDLRDAGFNLAPMFKGVINDTSDEVGRVHYGALFVMEVPDEFTPQCSEDELATRGMIDISALKTEVLENWSNIVIEHLSK